MPLTFVDSQVMVGIMLPGTIVVVFAVAHAERLNTPSSFMLVGGVSATSEMCLTGLENVGASLSHAVQQLQS